MNIFFWSTNYSDPKAILTLDPVYILKATDRYLAIWRPGPSDPAGERQGSTKGAAVACVVRQAVTSLISINYAYQRSAGARLIIIRRDKLALAMTPVWLATVLEGRNVCLDGHTD